MLYAEVDGEKRTGRAWPSRRLSRLPCAIGAEMRELESVALGTQGR